MVLRTGPTNQVAGYSITYAPFLLPAAEATIPKSQGQNADMSEVLLLISASEARVELRD